jgi:hypothetical protein
LVLNGSVDDRSNIALRRMHITPPRARLKAGLY